jgi:hypothetical protein
MEEISTPAFQCCKSGMFVPDPDFFYPEAELRISDPKATKRGEEQNEFLPTNKEFEYFKP